MKIYTAIRLGFRTISNHLRFIVFFCLFYIVLSGCGPSIMSISNDRTKAIDPIGLYVVSSSQQILTEDTEDNGFVIRLMGNFISGLFAKKGYLIKPLNAKIKKSDVFEKYSVYFNVDKERIAKIGKKERCSSVLIMYLAFSGESLRLKNGTTVYLSCSLYGWLVETQNGKTISSSQTISNSFDKFKENNPTRFNKQSTSKAYRSFLTYMASEMFYPFPKRK